MNTSNTIKLELKSNPMWHSYVEYGFFYIGSSEDGLIKFGISKNEKQLQNRVNAHISTYCTHFSKHYKILKNWRSWRIKDYKAMELVFLREIKDYSIQSRTKCSYKSMEWVEITLNDFELDNLVESIFKTSIEMFSKKETAQLEIKQVYNLKEREKRLWKSLV
jgi:hypothetical protein